MPTEQTATSCFIPRDTANALHAETVADVARFNAVPVRERKERQERVLRGDAAVSVSITRSEVQVYRRKGDTYRMVPTWRLEIDGVFRQNHPRKADLERIADVLVARAAR